MKILRLISQDGGICIPYDNYALEIRKVQHNDRNFYFIDAINTLNSNDKKYPMGVYNTRKEAIEVIRRINHTFCSMKERTYICFYFPEDVNTNKYYVDPEYNYSD